jgi:hypothetical protein
MYVYMNGMKIIYVKDFTHIYSSNDKTTIRTQKCLVLRREEKESNL